MDVIKIPRMPFDDSGRGMRIIIEIRLKTVTVKLTP